MIVALAAMVAAAAMAPTGNWITQDGSVMVAIAPCGPSLCGSIVKVLKVEPGAASTDVHNPDPALRSKPIVGLKILGGFRSSGSEWSHGSIYDPKTGRTYSSKLDLNDDGSLKVSGCIAFLCQTQRWRRAH